VVVGEREGLVDKFSQSFGMVVTGEVFLMVDAGSILTHSHRTGVGAGVDI
jgi:hypothetical protein